MPYHFEWDRLNAILRVYYKGRVDDESIKACYRATPAAVQRSSPRALIIDLSGVTEFDVSSATIRELAAQPTVADPRIPRLIVAPTAYMFGIPRMFQILGAEARPMLGVARSLAEAYAELGVSDVHFEPLL